MSRFSMHRGHCGTKRCFSEPILRANGLTSIAISAILSISVGTAAVAEPFVFVDDFWKEAEYVSTPPLLLLVLSPFIVIRGDDDGEGGWPVCNKQCGEYWHTLHKSQTNWHTHTHTSGLEKPVCKTTKQLENNFNKNIKVFENIRVQVHQCLIENWR